MTKTKELQLLETFLERAWNNADAGAIDDMYDGGTVGGLGTHPLMTPEAFRGYHTAIFGLLHDFDFKLDMCQQDGPWISTLCTVNAKTRAGDEPVAIPGSMWVRVEDDKIKEAYNHFNFMGLWEQLGFLPEGSFEMALRGEKIA